MNEINRNKFNLIEEDPSEEITFNPVEVSCSAEFSEGCIFFEV
jgi:hypothetical protein